MRHLTAYLLIRPKLAKTPSGSLRRLRDLVMQASGDAEGRVRSFGVVSPDRSELSPEETTIRRSQMKAALKSLGRGYVVQTGFWNETVTGTRGEQLKVPVREMSFFIPGITLKQLRELASWFDQEGVVYAGPETQGQVQVLGDGWADTIGSLQTLTNTPQAEVEGYENRSELKGRPYVFASWPTLLQPRRN